MTRTRITAVVILIASLLLGFFVYSTEQGNSPYALQYGLDLSGGTHLVYQADTSKLQQSEVDNSMQTLRDVIEERVNSLGVSDPLVQVEQGGTVAGKTKQRLIVELPGVQDIAKAKKQIGETPTLEFKLVRPGQTPPRRLSTSTATATSPATTTVSATTTEGAATTSQPALEDTGLTGRFLRGASMQFQGQGVRNQPIVTLDFNEEGRQMFAEITGNNVGRRLAIYLDGQLVSSPEIQGKITSNASITGISNPEEAQNIARRLNFGALPVPIDLVSERTIGASLGERVKDKGIYAGAVGLVLVSLFMIGWYRLQGLIAVGALGTYLIVMLTIFKMLPVTLTAAGIAGFILSIGMAVDANVLIFERIKEELGESHDDMQELIKEGFSRAWPSIRDANISSMITAVILYMIGTTLTQGFAVTFGLGVFVSMLSAVVISRTFLLALGGKSRTKTKHTLLAPGLRSGNDYNEHTD